MNFSATMSTDANFTILGDSNLDLFIPVYTFYAHRIPFYEFLPALVTTEAYAFFRQPTHFVHNIFLLPFSRMVWISFGITWIVIFTAVLYLNWQIKNSLGFGIFCDILISVLSVMTSRGWRSQIIDKSGFRLIVFTALGTSFLIVTFYTASFVASISAPVVPIRNFQDFEKYMFQTFTGPDYLIYSLDFVENEKEKRGLIERSRTLFRGDKDAVGKVMTEDSKFVFLVENDGFYSFGRYYNFSDTDLCKVSSIHRAGEHNGFTWKNSMLLKKHAPYVEVFRWRITMMIERGLNHRYWAEYYLQTLLHCLPQESQELHKELNLDECLPAFQFLGVSFLIALIAVIIEKQFCIQQEVSNTLSTVIVAW